MAWFKKNDTEIEDIPEEIQGYYDSERKQRASVAWALAFFSLILTLAVATGVYYGGRAVYRRVKDKDNTSVATTSPTAPSAPNETAEPTPKIEDIASPTDTGEEQTPTQSSTPPSTTPQPSAQNSQPAPSTSQPAPQPSTPQVAGSSTQALPNTGPANVIAIFAITSLVSGISYHFVATKKEN